MIIENEDYITKLHRFLEETRRFTKNSGPLNIDRLRSFLDTFNVVEKETIRTNRLFAPSFNLFNFLGISRDEVRTHSGTLVELLSPSGSHGQGCLFLGAFLEKCKEKDPSNYALKSLPVDIDNGKWSVHKEFSTKYGRMDIVLFNPILGFLCVIENKIDAYEQYDQLLRYSNWLDDMEKEDFPYHLLVFLTPRGEVATTSGIKPYVSLSYKTDLFRTLTSVIDKIQADAVKWFVTQYCDLLAYL